MQDTSQKHKRPELILDPVLEASQVRPRNAQFNKLVDAPTLQKRPALFKVFQDERNRAQAVNDLSSEAPSSIEPNSTALPQLRPPEVLRQSLPPPEVGTRPQLTRLKSTGTTFKTSNIV